MKFFAAAAMAISMALPASAATLADIDLNALTFDINGFGSNPVMTGNSNGVGFTFTAASRINIPFSNTSGRQAFNDLPNRYDDIHAGNSFSIVFDTPISSLLIALANDNNTLDGPDFGMTPDEVTGINVVGTLLSITDIRGALALFNFATPITTFTHTQTPRNRYDGWDTAFFVTGTPAAVPLPASLPLLLGALGAISLICRRKTQA